MEHRYTQRFLSAYSVYGAKKERGERKVERKYDQPCTGGSVSELALATCVWSGLLLASQSHVLTCTIITDLLECGYTDKACPLRLYLCAASMPASAVARWHNERALK